MKVKHLLPIFVAIFVSSIVVSYFVISPMIKNEKYERLGDFAKDFLKGDKYNNVLIEIDYIKGYSPNNDAMNVLKDRIKTYTQKTISGGNNNELQKEKDKYSIDDIIALEKKHRNNFNKDKTIVLYILYLNGEYSEDKNVLGVAYAASSIAIFKEQIDNVEIPFPARAFGVENSDIEKSVLVHEFGHILALVNINYKSNADHEDPSHKNHCINESCVMYYAIETSMESYLNNFINTGNPEPPSDYDDDCKNDLEMIRSS